MTTRNTLRTEVSTRLGDVSNAIWTTGEVDGYLDFAMRGLYPTFYQRKVEETSAGAGPLQAMPNGARNLYMVGYQRIGSTRVRPLRGWSEGQGQAFIPKTGITGGLLVWAWTTGWDAPASGTEVLRIPTESEEFVVLRAQVSALEKLLTDRVSVERYLALSLRQGTTEDDVATAIDALHASLRERSERVVPLPEVVR